tara:strand:- start:63 stop:902 length:840 start_codon:yes stop_codon:yes gene_type:complete
MFSPISNTTFSYILSLGRFRDEFVTAIKPSWVKITTITMISKLKYEIDIDTIRKYIADNGSFYVGKGTHYYKWKLKTNKFYNQITMTFKDRFSTKSIKLFPNGSVQVAGCADLFDCKRVIDQITIVLKELTDQDNEPIQDFRVVMINTNFSTNYSLNLYELVDHFSANSLFDVSFDPDRYSAVKIKFKPAQDMKYITVSVFCTGRVIITGAENLKEIAYTYNIINRHINKNPNIKVSPSPVIDVYDQFCGYNVNDLIDYISKQGFRPWGYTQGNYKINF